MFSLKKIIEYIKERYSPLSIIVYGSYADGTNGPYSDFDALVISSCHGQSHDTSFVDGVQLDVFVFPASCFEGEFDCADYIQICEGKIIEDSEGIGLALQKCVLSFLESRPAKSNSDIQDGIDWCIKMCERVKRGDTEGLFRWHWLLTDSLEIFCDAARHPYMGPKKALKWMEKEHPAAFALYDKALRESDMESLDAWIACIKNLNIQG